MQNALEKEQLDELNGFFEVNLDLLCIADFEGNFVGDGNERKIRPRKHVEEAVK